jgi:hypothetical protein
MFGVTGVLRGGGFDEQEPRNSSPSPKSRCTQDTSNESLLHLSTPPLVPVPQRLPFFSKLRIVRRRFYLLSVLGWNGIINLDPNQNRDCVRCRRVWIVTTRVHSVDILISICSLLFVCDRSFLSIYFEDLCMMLAPFVPHKNRVGPSNAIEAGHKYCCRHNPQNRTTPPESLRYVTRDAGLFKQIYIATLIVRPPKYEWLSLKRVTGFGIYKCHPTEDYHTAVEYDSATKRDLAELFKDYQTRCWTLEDYGDRWMNWIHTEFNNNDNDRRNGKYLLQLIQGRSVPKLILWVITPIVLSLVIGVWYMLTPQPGEDYVAVVQTTWTIASYIVTSAACKDPPYLREVY